MPLNQQRLNIFGDYTLQGIYKLAKNDTTSVIRAGQLSTVMGGALLTFNPKSGETLDEDKTSFSVGAMYRWGDAVAGVVRIEHYRFNFGFSYDVNISKLSVASKTVGGLEFTLGYRLNNCSTSSTRCPKF